jgi:hypothetical protein
VNWTPHAAIAAHAIIHDAAQSPPLSIAAPAETKPICLCIGESKSFNTKTAEKGNSSPRPLCFALGELGVRNPPASKTKAVN